MTRKKFVKLMMAHGLDRNMANHLAEFVRRFNMSYFNMSWPFFSMDQAEEPLVLVRRKSFAFEVDEPDFEGVTR